MTAKTGDNKIRRSRNGCNECRRLHRRCGEQKPACETCVTDGKECSYERTLGWITGTSKRANARARRAQVRNGVVSPPASNSSSSDDDATSLQALPGLPGTVNWLPWLSTRHRSLVAHFANTTCSISFLDIKSHHSLCSAILPLALDTTWSFHLVAAILCVSMTHRTSLGLETDASEIDYWESMAVGHLRRQKVNHDETSENVFATTALLLCMKEIISGGEKAHSWRAHLQGAMAVLEKPTLEGTLEREHLRKLGQTMQRLALIFCLPTHAKVKPVCSSPFHFSSCDYFDEELGFSAAILHTLHDIEQVAADMTALLHLEHASTGQDIDMESLWASLMDRINALVKQSEVILEDLAALKEEVESATELTEHEEFALLNQAYYHITLSQVQLRLLGHDVDSDHVQEALASAMHCVQKIKFRDHSSPAMALLQPAFIIGCFAGSGEMREQVLAVLDTMKRQHGRENAKRARELLVELWVRRDGESDVAREERLHLRQKLGVPHRARSYEWSDLMAEKGWDLCLW
ncbi:hypothetical protein M409DRAFT_53475 [Zasmidium cellare ATCC 36951]|uniref:Zn(2)-C6 fungal-type domain-containing protein n=1 Tax=Zasmidium cellare ATCC 36951 TaxID=1080233 RepID=A0A6A6CPL1_ZASCE|nr:uncharacterized protein M409DRAFT_53475 [Zasmidium cellare ATCC 36951]KAF2168168.1 hypothetical protein M409DRAFT_53475 [Zasmidium cellare ATCC 36951]